MAESGGRLGVSGAQVVGSALAAMSSAVLLSTVGVAGTLIGAAFGSVVITIGGAAYTYYLDASKKKMRKASASAKEKLNAAQGRKRKARAGSPVAQDRMDQELNEAERELEEAESGTENSERVFWREVLKNLNWKRIGLLAAGLFVLVMGIILAFELSVGRPVSSFTGGSGADGPRTSIPFGRPSDAGDKKNDGNNPGENSPDEQKEQQTPSDQEPTEPSSTESGGTEPTEPSTTQPTEDSAPEEPAPTRQQPQEPAPQGGAPQDDAPAE